ncbi:15964_t:CDS:1, partial [Racocetra persica]
MSYLESCQGNYKMENWDNVCVRINDLMNAKKWGDMNKFEKAANRMKKEIISEMDKQIGNQLNQSIRQIIQEESANTPVL